MDSAPVSREWADRQAAALELAEEGLGVWTADDGVPVSARGSRRQEAKVALLPDVPALIADFGRRFPEGFAYDTSREPPAALVAMPSRLRVEIYRAALLFARGLRRGRGPDNWEVTALVANGSLRAIFAVDRRESSSARRAWRHIVRAWTVRAAAGVPVSGSRPASERATENDAAAREGAIL
jgi:hypothetical protein